MKYVPDNTDGIKTELLHPLQWRMKTEDKTPLLNSGKATKTTFDSIRSWLCIMGMKISATVIKVKRVAKAEVSRAGNRTPATVVKAPDPNH
eukprot:gene2834-3277_t